MASKLNREWHVAHRMPKNATLAQRVAWHVEHSRACACRPMPASIAAELAKQPKPAPRRPSSRTSA